MTNTSSQVDKGIFLFAWSVDQFSEVSDFFFFFQTREESVEFIDVNIRKFSDLVGGSKGSKLLRDILLI